MTDANIYLMQSDGTIIGADASHPLYVYDVSSPLAEFELPEKTKYIYIKSEPETIEKIQYVETECNCGWCRLKRLVQYGCKWISERCKR